MKAKPRKSLLSVQKRLVLPQSAGLVLAFLLHHVQ
jgi:hypothetical protein